MDFNLKNAIIIIDEGHNIAAEAESCQTKQFDNNDIMLCYKELKMLKANKEYYNMYLKEKAKSDPQFFLRSDPSDFQNIKSQMNLIKKFIREPQSFVAEKFDLQKNALEKDLEESQQGQKIFHEISLLKVFPHIEYLQISFQRILEDSCKPNSY